MAQVYVSQAKSLLPRPEKELKAFEKVLLQPGQQKTVTLSLKEDAFQYFNDVQHKWVMEKGVFHILVGGSSKDIKLNGKVTL